MTATRRKGLRLGVGLLLAGTMAAAPGLAAAQSRQSPPDSGGSDVDTARAVVGVLGLLAKKAREAEAKKKEEAARKKREEEAAARQAEADAAAAAAATAPAQPATRTAAPTPPPTTARPAQEPRQTLSGTIDRTPPPSIRKSVVPPPAEPTSVAKAPERPVAPKPVRPAGPAPSVVAPPPPVAAPPPVVAARPPPVLAEPAPPSPAAPAPPWTAIGLGIGVLLAMLIAAAMAAGRTFGWFLAPPPRVKTWVDAGEASAPVFASPLTGPLPSLEISRGGFVSEALFPEPAV